MAWTVRVIANASGQLYLVYVLLEFQSGPHPRMATRMDMYAVQDVLKLPAEEPPTGVQIVLYTGRDRWSAPTDLAVYHERASPW